MNNEILFKVKCIYTVTAYLTVGKEYDVVEVDGCLYKIKNDSGEFKWYYNNRFEILDRESNPKDKQEFFVGDNVVVNKISIDYAPSVDKNVKVGDIATVITVSGCDLELSNANWKNSWWFSKDDVSLVTDNNPLDDNSLDYHPLSHQEITGSDLTKEMFERGDFAVVCKCSNIGEYSAIAVSPLRLITEYSEERFLDNTGHLWEYAVPCDPKTNLPLTEDVLNETI